MEKILFFGKDGIIAGRVPLSERADLAGVKAPRVEMDFGHYVEEVFESGAADYLDKLSEFVAKVYDDWGKFGYYGDVVQVSLQRTAYAGLVRVICSIDFVGQLAWPKGVLAADILPIFIDSLGNQFFVGITLGGGANEGKPALIGGHIDRNGFHLETPAEALVHEAKEEAGIFFIPTEEYRQQVEDIPFLDKVGIAIEFDGKIYPADLKLLRTYRTSEAGKREKLGYKRVDWTTAYYMVVKVDYPLDKKKIAETLKAGSDAGGLIIIELGKDKTPEFVHEHHREIFQDAIRRF